jgi:signal transduction histidine kinase/FixJ family two-component response regulator
MTTTRILIVDDDPALLQALPETLRLRMEEAIVDTSDSAPAALERIAIADYDAIICDIKMPGMDGLALLAEIRARRPDTPTLLITGHGEHDLAVQAVRGGAHDFIQKPIDRDQLVASLNRAIQMRQLSRRVERQKLALERHAGELEQIVQERTRELLETNLAKSALIEARDQALVEARAAQRRLAFLAEASKQLADSLDDETRLTRVARLVVPYLADRCFVDIIQEDGSIRRMAAAPADPSEAPAPAAPRSHEQLTGNGSHPPQTPPADRLEMIAKALPTLLMSTIRSAESRGIIDELGGSAYMIVPLRVRDRTLGAMTFVAAESGRRYTSDDLALAEDLAWRVATAVENAQLYSAAQEALQVRDHFLSIAAHELKTPITSLRGYAEFLHQHATREGALTERQRHVLRVIMAQADRLNMLVVTLLDLARIETGQLSIERGVVDLNGLVQRLVAELQPILDRHTIVFRSADAPQIVDGDELRLEQVLQNLIQNAIKYSPEGGLVSLEIERRDEMARIAVTDQGLGIPPSGLSQLFSRFYRAPNANVQNISGMGVGLYVVKEIVALHGGTVEVTSVEGAGSTFTVCLPIADRLIESLSQAYDHLASSAK